MATILNVTRFSLAFITTMIKFIKTILIGT